MTNPIYKPSGRALEYSPDALALNIYTGCNHGCTYCFAPSILRKTREEFHSNVTPRKDIVESVKRQLHREQITDKLIHLCFTCDPYPADIDTSVTREIIEAIKNSGNHVQILTKGGFRASRDFNLLDSNDWFGVTYSGVRTVLNYTSKTRAEPNAAPHSERLTTLKSAHKQGIKTWVSCEPVLNAMDILNLIRNINCIDLYRIGKLNYAPSDIDWYEFGHKCAHLCRWHNRNYYIKADLRTEMEVNV